MANEDTLTRALGWFSIGLGLAQLAAPQGVAKLIGVQDDEDNRNLLRGIGLREITSGVGILTREHPTGWLWSRVGGDAMDLSLLGKALMSSDNDRSRTAAATAAVAGVAALDLLCSLQLSKSSTNGAGFDAGPRTIDVNKSITVNRDISEVYQYWRDFENLPSFMRHLQSVKITGPNQTHWVATAPAGRTVEWDAEMVEDRPDELIAWQSLPGADIPNSGSVRFARSADGKTTEVRLKLEYQAPAGQIGAVIAKLFGEEPQLQVNDDLRRFKQVMEVGEVVQADGSPNGPYSPQRAGQPLPA